MMFVWPGPEFDRVEKALREVDSTMRVRLREAMRDEIKPAVQKAQARVRTLPTPSQAGSTGLRRRVSRGVKIQNGGPSLVRVITTMVDPSEAIIPRGLDRTAGWRHPVFGNKDNWVRQRGYSWFRETLADARPDIVGALTDVLEDARDTVNRAGGGPM